MNIAQPKLKARPSIVLFDSCHYFEMATETDGWTAEQNDQQCWNYVPDPVLLDIFQYLHADELLNAGLVCRTWCRISRDEILWKHLFFRDFHIDTRIPMVSDGTGWLDEYHRLCSEIPIVQTEVLDAHSHQVLHVSFAHNGTMFATSSKDGTIIVWNSSYPCQLKYQHDMKEFQWKYTQFSQFNCSDSLLLVSGIYFGSPHSTSGEIAVFTLQNEFLLQCRVVNKPYDMFGCWIGEHHLLSGELHWLAHLTSSSILWVNKASQDTHSEHSPIISPLYKFYNPNASSVRSIMIGDCKWVGEAEECGGHVGVEVVGELTPRQQQEQRKDSLDLVYKPHFYNSRHFSASQSIEESCSESDSGSWSGSSHGEELRNKLLVFSMGSSTYSPHQIGFKRIDKIVFPQRMPPGPSIKERLAARERERERERENDQIQPNWADFDSVREKFDVPDKVIDLHGHIIGMAMSPDHRYLYVNSRPWPANYSIENPMSPPPIASRVDMHVIDLTSLCVVGSVLRKHQDYTPHSHCFFIFMDVSDKYLASGTQDNTAHIWDRHYGTCLALLPHSDWVNGIALNPVDSHMCVSASDDYTVRVWRSKTASKQLNIYRRGQIEGMPYRSR